MMKFVVLAALVAFAAGDVSHLLRPIQKAYRPVPVAPRPVVHSASGPQIAILRLENDISPDGSYQWAYETENGIAAQEAAQVRALGPEQVAKAAQGSFSWTSPEGEPVQIQYVADENGYQPAGAAIPVPPPVPAAIQRSLEWIAAHPQPQENLPVRRY